MPRYFFHVRMKQGPVIPDRIGIEFRNLATAGGLSLSVSALPLAKRTETEL